MITHHEHDLHVSKRHIYKSVKAKLSSKGVVSNVTLTKPETKLVYLKKALRIHIQSEL